jgi:sec-independent protein translocase protein TatA
MLGNLTGWHFLIILIVILLLFGAPKLPGLAKSLGQSMKIFRNEVKDLRDDDKKTDATGAAAPTQQPTASAEADQQQAPRAPGGGSTPNLP